MDNTTKQFLVKLAYTPAPFHGGLYHSGYQGLPAAQQATNVSRDIQNYGHLAPGSAEYNQAMTAGKFSPQYMQGLTSAGQRALSAADDPRFVAGMQDGTADLSSLYSDIDPVQAMGGSLAAARSAGVGNIAGAAGDVAGKGLAALRQDPMGATLNALQNPLDTARQGFNDFKGNLANRVAPGVKDSLRQSIDFNSPLMRQVKSRGATTYMGNKIDSMTSGMGGFGKNLKGFLHFLLGMGSRIPGYETLTNKVMDWTGVTDKMRGGLVKPAFAKLASASPYANYRVIHRTATAEILSPWNRR